MYKAKITSKGQITLPAEVREALGVRPGERVVFLPATGGEFRVRRATSILDLAGCVPYSGPPVTVEEMKQAVAEQAAALDEALMSPASRRRSRRSRKQAA
jgi:AbrB family looped-hinge helix DNA binding protein